MNIICFGQQNWDYCWTGKQQLMTRLAKRGHRVLYIDPDLVQVPVRGVDQLRALAPELSGFGVRQVGPGELHVFTYHYVPALRWRANCLRHNLSIPGVAAKLGFSRPVVISMRPDAGKRIRSVRPSALLYQAIDEWTGFGQYERDPAAAAKIREQEDELVRQCQIAFGVSPVLVQRLQTVNPRTYLLESAADVEHFSPYKLDAASGDPRLRDLPHPRIGFVGQVDARLDQELLLALAKARPQWSFVLAGRQHAEVDFGAIRDVPNIHMLGYVPYSELPSVVKEFDVCVVPYRSTSLTNSCSPLKVFEYLATGKPVVSTRLKGMGSAGEAVCIAEDAAGFLEALEQAIAHPEHGRDRRLAVAAENSWDRRVDFLETCFHDALAIAHGGAGNRPDSGWQSRRVASEPVRAQKIED